MWISQLARDWLETADSWNMPHEKHMLKFEESLIGWISWVIRNSGQFMSDLWNSLLSYFFSVSFLISLQTLYKPSLPTKCKKNKEYSQETFERKNPSQTLESYRLFTHNPLHYFSRVSIYSYLSIYMFWVLREVLVPMGSIRRNHWVADVIGQYYRI